MCEAKSEGGRRCPGIRRRCIESNQRGLADARAHLEKLNAQSPRPPAPELFAAMRDVEAWEERVAVATTKGRSLAEQRDDLQATIDSPSTTVLDRERAKHDLKDVLATIEERNQRRSQEHRQNEALTHALTNAGIPERDITRILSIRAGSPLAPTPRPSLTTAQHQLDAAEQNLRRARKDASARLETVKARVFEEEGKSLPTSALTEHPAYKAALERGYQDLIAAQHEVERARTATHLAPGGLTKLRNEVRRQEREYRTAERALSKTVTEEYTPWITPQYAVHHATAQDAVEQHKHAIAERLQAKVKESPQSHAVLARMATQTLNTSKDAVYERAFHASVVKHHRQEFDALSAQYQSLQRTKARLRGYEALERAQVSEVSAQDQRRMAIREAAQRAGLDPDVVLDAVAEHTTTGTHTAPRTARLDFAVTPEQAEHLRQEAEQAGTPFADHVRTRLLGKPTALQGPMKRPRRTTPGNHGTARSVRLSVLLTPRERETIARRATAFGMPDATYGWAISTPASGNTAH